MEVSTGVFGCKYCHGDVLWLKVDNESVLVNAKKVRVIVPVIKSAGNIVGDDVSLLDEIYYHNVEAYKKHYCKKVGI